MLVVAQKKIVTTASEVPNKRKQHRQQYKLDLSNQIFLPSWFQHNVEQTMLSTLSFSQADGLFCSAYNQRRTTCCIQAVPCYFLSGCGNFH